MAVNFITQTVIIDDFIAILRDTTVRGLAIETHVQAEYSKTLKIYDQPDAYDVPGEEDIPFVCIYRNRHDLGESVGSWNYEVELEVGIVKKGQDTTDPNVTLQNGVRSLETLVYLIYDALRTYVPCNGNIDVASLEIDETQHPLYIGYLTVNINVPQVIGSTIGHV